VGDAARKLTDGLHLLRLPELFFALTKGLSGFLAFRHVSQGRQYDASTIQLEVGRRDLNLDGHVVLRAMPAHRDPRCPIAGTRQGLLGLERNVRMFHGEPLFPGVPVEGTRGAVGLQNLAGFCVYEDDGV
jgi:hypothetical protein